MKNPSISRAEIIRSIIAIGLCLPGILASCAPANIEPTVTPRPPAPTVLPPTRPGPGATEELHALPAFPWPPPKPSAFTSLTLGSLEGLVGKGLTFQDVDRRITGALSLAGYDERSYFAVPNGFAVVTRLEKTDAEGNPDSERWSSSLEPVSFAKFSLTKYLEALFSAPKGHYRVFVFIVTSDPVVQSGTPVAQATAQTWIVEGSDRLPFEMEGIPYTSQHKTTAYIYEFIQSGVGAEANQNIPSTITGRQHLERAGLWNSLSADCLPDSGDLFISYGSIVNGGFCPPRDDRDSFYFSGSSGDKIWILIQTTDPGFMPCTVLYAPDHLGEDLGCEPVMTATLRQSGTYQIRLTNPDRRKAGDYTLFVERSE